MSLFGFQALEALRERSRQLPNCSDAGNFQNPQKRVQDISNQFADIRRSIGTKIDDLSKAETASQFSNDADQLIKASIITTQQSAVPKGFLEEEENRPYPIPRNYIEAMNALNDSKVSFN